MGPSFPASQRACLGWIEPAARAGRRKDFAAAAAAFQALAAEIGFDRVVVALAPRSRAPSALIGPQTKISGPLFTAKFSAVAAADPSVWRLSWSMKKTVDDLAPLKFSGPDYWARMPPRAAAFERQLEDQFDVKGFLSAPIGLRPARDGTARFGVAIAYALEDQAGFAQLCQERGRDFLAAARYFLMALDVAQREDGVSTALLTPTESFCVALFAAGLSPAQIGAQFVNSEQSASPSTVATHLRRARAKLQAWSSQEAAIYAVLEALSRPAAEPD